MSLTKDDYRELYEVLKGSRVIKGNFTFKGYDTNDNSEDYEELFYSICEMLKGDIGNNYWLWYDRLVDRYVKYKINTNKTESVYIPQKRYISEEHTVRQQLSVLKFYIYRKSQSNY